jgi:histidine phosphotransfer protein HptB
MEDPMSHPFIYSKLAVDPDLGELVEMFVQEMPDRLNALEAQACNRNWEELTRTAHQLKGAAGGYGFPLLTLYASRLENALRESRPEEEIVSSLDELRDLRVRRWREALAGTFDACRNRLPAATH